jgi:sialic acid synthase SpsE
VTYEAGPTHDGLDSAKRLTTLAAEAGADAVKFQLVDPDRLVADRSARFSYDILVDRETGRTETVQEPLYDILCRRTLIEAEWRELKAHSDQAGLAFFATATSMADVDFLAELGCHSVKIASADVNYLQLIRHAARTGMCLQLDTGNATLGEIEVAVDAIREEGNENIIIHQCPSGYPARIESVNLNILVTLKQMFGYPVAFSDHTPGRDMDVAAVAMGANLVEKTITLDRTTRSVEHIMSLEPAEMREFIQVIRDVERAKGETRRLMGPEEKRKRDANRRSAYLLREVQAGEEVRESVVEFRRPGYGIGPDMFPAIEGGRFRHTLDTGHRLSLRDIESA